MNTARRPRSTTWICIGWTARGTPPRWDLDELFDSPALVMVEWGERFPELMPPERIEIRLRALEGDEREIEVGQVGNLMPIVNRS